MGDAEHMPREGNAAIKAPKAEWCCVLGEEQGTSPAEQLLVKLEARYSEAAAGSRSWGPQGAVFLFQRVMSYRKKSRNTFTQSGIMVCEARLTR